MNIISDWSWCHSQEIHKKSLKFAGNFEEKYEICAYGAQRISLTHLYRFSDGYRVNKLSVNSLNVHVFKVKVISKLSICTIYTKMFVFKWFFFQVGLRGHLTKKLRKKQFIFSLFPCNFGAVFFNKLAKSTYRVIHKERERVAGRGYSRFDAKS